MKNNKNGPIGQVGPVGQTREKFTPGPWHYESCKNVSGFKVVDANGRMLILGAAATEERRGEALHNVQLCAVAPILYYLLDYLLVVAKELLTPEVRKEIEETLKEARGEQ